MKIIYVQFFTASPLRLWTGANDIDNDGIFTFALENGSLSFNDLPFGSGKFYDNLAKVYTSTPYVDETANAQHKKCVIYRT